MMTMTMTTTWISNLARTKKLEQIDRRRGSGKSEQSTGNRTITTESLTILYRAMNVHK